MLWPFSRWRNDIEYCKARTRYAWRNANDKQYLKWNKRVEELGGWNTK